MADRLTPAVGQLNGTVIGRALLTLFQLNDDAGLMALCAALVRPGRATTADGGPQTRRDVLDRVTSACLDVCLNQALQCVLDPLLAGPCHLHWRALRVRQVHKNVVTGDAWERNPANHPDVDKSHHQGKHAGKTGQCRVAPLKHPGQQGLIVGADRPFQPSGYTLLEAPECIELTVA